MDVTPATTSSICGAQAGAGHLSSSQQFREVGAHVPILLMRKPRLRDLKNLSRVTQHSTELAAGLSKVRLPNPHALQEKLVPRGQGPY